MVSWYTLGVNRLQPLKRLLLDLIYNANACKCGIPLCRWLTHHRPNSFLDPGFKLSVIIQSKALAGDNSLPQATATGHAQLVPTMARSEKVVDKTYNHWQVDHSLTRITMIDQNYNDLIIHWSDDMISFSYSPPVKSGLSGVILRRPFIDPIASSSMMKQFYFLQL